MKLVSTLVAGLLLASAGLANAEPVALNDTQLEHVTAGATAIALGGTITFGEWISAGTAITGVVADSVNQKAAGFSYTQTAAASLTGPALAASGSKVIATLP